MGPRPYRKGLAEASLASLRDGGWLLPHALVVVEETADAGFAAPKDYAEIERRLYDDTEVTFLRISGAHPVSGVGSDPEA